MGSDETTNGTQSGCAIHASLQSHWNSVKARIELMFFPVKTWSMEPGTVLTVPGKPRVSCDSTGYPTMANSSTSIGVAEGESLSRSSSTSTRIVLLACKRLSSKSFRQRILDQVLDDASQRSRSIRVIVPTLRRGGPSLPRNFDVDAPARSAAFAPASIPTRRSRESAPSSTSGRRWSRRSGSGTPVGTSA